MPTKQTIFSSVLRRFELQARARGYFELSNWLSDCAEAVERNDKHQHLARRFNHGSRPAIAADGSKFFTGVNESIMFEPQSWHLGAE